MNPDFDVIIIGSGPAGVSAAFPLVNAGLRVLMVDGGKKAQEPPPTENFLSWRANDAFQARRMVGQQFHALKMHEAVSPKLRVPSLSYVFDQFNEENRIKSENFITIGSLATGGLSNAWGCGAACLSSSELMSLPFPSTEMVDSYAAVAKRVGISGGGSDDLSDFFGLDEWSQSPVKLDKLHSHLLERYSIKKSQNAFQDFKMGRSRLAIISKDHNGREACNSDGNCFWGCAKRSMYSAVDEVNILNKFHNFQIKKGYLVESIVGEAGNWRIEVKCLENKELYSFHGKKILIAAGTIASTRLALKTLRYHDPISMLSCPTAGFMVWFPKFLGRKLESSLCLGQLAFTVQVSKNTVAYGATLPASCVPISEFIRHLPFTQSNSISIMRHLLSSCVIGTTFLPGVYGRSIVQLDKLQNLNFSAKENPDKKLLMNKAKSVLSYSFRQMGGVLLPRGFKEGGAGSDIHYSGTLPMSENPRATETTPLGEIPMLKGIHVVDGSCLPFLPEKPHTLTIMANADRIAKKIVNQLCL